MLTRLSGARLRLDAFVTSVRFERFIVAVILLNAASLGLETVPWITGRYEVVLVFIDQIALAVFVAELSLKMIAAGFRFFNRAWNIFDFVIVVVSVAPMFDNFTILRAFRVLRVPRLMSMFPSMRIVIQALIESIPGMGSVLALLCLVLYVFAVLSTRLFGADFPEWFGSIGASLYSLFQVMTLESWSMGIVRPVMEVYPLAWLFFVIFIMMSAFAFLNLVIAVMVRAMHVTLSNEAEDEISSHQEALVTEIRELRRELATLRERLPAPVGEAPSGGANETG